MVWEVDHKVCDMITGALPAVVGLCIISVTGLRYQLSVHVDEASLIVIPRKHRVGEEENMVNSPEWCRKGSEIKCAPSHQVSMKMYRSETVTPW
jgi:hypothetical protein